MILVRGFRQMLLVVRVASRLEIFGASLKTLQLYLLFKVLHLSKSMRPSALWSDASVEDDALTLPSLLLDIDEGSFPNSFTF